MVSEDRIEQILGKLMDAHRLVNNLNFERLTAKIEGINSKLDKFSTTNNAIAKQINELESRVARNERSAKKNNIIVYGIPDGLDSDISKVTLTTLNTLLETSLSVNDLNNIFRIGKSINGKPRPILVQFVSFLKKQTIYANINNLKGTNIAMQVI